jgi:serine O-acetyltransferase
MLNKLKFILYAPQLCFPIFGYVITKKDERIEKDISAWKKQYKIKGGSNLYCIIYLLVNFKDFRNLYYYRLKCIAKNIKNSFFKRGVVAIILLISEFTLRKYNTLLISGDIGGGLVLIHAYFSILSPQKMGENCKIWHEVTIGYRDYIAPIIGDNVQISPGAKIIGNIYIGDNSKIGPNALVLENIPENSVVVSAKATILKSTN